MATSSIYVDYVDESYIDDIKSIIIISKLSPSAEPKINYESNEILYSDDASRQKLKLYF